MSRLRFLRHRPDGERGAAAVETSMVLGILLLLALGAFEYGLVFENWISVTSASREAARTAASAGDNANADCYILEAAAGPLSSVEDDVVISISIFATDTSGVRGASNVYRPARPTDDPGSLKCSTWFPLSLGWPAEARDNEGSIRDWVGVEIEFDHDWKSGFLWFSGSVCERGTAAESECWKQETIMHLEPEANPY